MLALELLDVLLDELLDVLGVAGLAVVLLEEPLEVPDDSLVDVVDEVDGFDFASRESVREKPEPLKWMPTPVKTLRRVDSPQSGQTVRLGSVIFC